MEEARTRTIQELRDDIVENVPDALRQHVLTLQRGIAALKEEQRQARMNHKRLEMNLERMEESLQFIRSVVFAITDDTQKVLLVRHLDRAYRQGSQDEGEED